MAMHLIRVGKVAAVLASAFVFGGASAEVAVRARAAVEQERQAREHGAAGELVSLKLTRPDGSVVAQPRLIAAAGRPARLVLHAPGRPDEVKVSFRVQVARQLGNVIALDYELVLPDESIFSHGRLHLSPGVQQAIQLPQGELVATWLAVPFPSAEFDAFIESERAARSAAKTS
jgi:hypothetical protein